MDSKELSVPVSKTVTKKHLCPYCKTLQTKFARHLELKHKTEEDVKKCIHFPKCNPERLQIIESIRRKGDYIHNTDAEINTGILITCRRAQKKFKSTADNYICCSHCLGYFSKQTLRLHHIKCNPKHKKGTRGQTVDGRRLTGDTSHRASQTMTSKILPVFQDDEVSRAIKYDELLIIFRNRLCEKYTLDHQHDMIRSQLRLLSRFKIAIRNLNKDITDLASVFHPRFYDNVIAAVQQCAKYNPKTKMFDSPSNASSLGTLLKKCAKLLNVECIKKEYEETKKHIDNFLSLLEEDFCITVNRKVVEDQTKKRRMKKTVLPSKDDIKKLYKYLNTMAIDSMAILNESFDIDSWKKLGEATLILVQMFNRRRAGEIERLLIEDYRNQETLEKTLNTDIYQSVSKKSQDQARKFVRLTIRGKKGRTVPTLLDSSLNKYIETILKYRNEAQVASTNQYVFAVPYSHSLQKEYLRACPLMRKFAFECGAKRPFSLRGTILRKHIATLTATLRVEENRVTDLANFLGHDKQIHKNVYRIPDGFVDMSEVSRLLQAAMGDEEDDEDDEDEEEDDIAEEQEQEQEQEAEQGQERGRKGRKKNQQVSTAESPTEALNPETDSSSESDDSKEEEVQVTESEDDDSIEYPSTSKGEGKKSAMTRRRWSDEERAAVRKEFGDLEKLQKLPSLQQCQILIKKTAVLSQRTPQQLKTWIDNQRKAEQRKRKPLV